MKTSLILAIASVFSTVAIAQTKADVPAKPAPVKVAATKANAAKNSAAKAAAAKATSTAAAAAIAAYETEQAKYAAAAEAMLRTSFKERGAVKLDRLDQDDTHKRCSTYAERDGTPNYKFTDGKLIEAANLKTLVYPADGVMLGDWKEGEKIAQSGIGKQFSDDPARPSGGNCYACHQLSKAELSFGNLGPSLNAYGKDRKYDPVEAKNAFGKIYNAQSVQACSTMPRFGHTGFLSEEQIKDAVAYLFDPESPVNK